MDFILLVGVVEMTHFLRLHQLDTLNGFTDQNKIVYLRLKIYNIAREATKKTVNLWHL